MFVEPYSKLCLNNKVPYINKVMKNKNATSTYLSIGLKCISGAFCYEFFYADS